MWISRQTLYGVLRPEASLVVTRRYNRPMPYPLRPNESIVYPQPFEDTQFNPIVITSERTTQVNETGGMLHLENKNIGGVVRANNTRILAAAVLLAFIGAPLVIIGVVKWKSSSAALSKPAPKKPKAGASRKEKADYEKYQDAKAARFPAYFLVPLGALFIGGGYLLFKKRFQVVCGGGGLIITIPVKDKNQQTQVLMTIQAVVNSAKQQAASMALAQKPPARR